MSVRIPRNVEKLEENTNGVNKQIVDSKADRVQVLILLLVGRIADDIAIRTGASSLTPP